MIDDDNGRGRRSLRLSGYDYSLGGNYFVTLCAYRRRSIFGKVVGDEVVLNDAGRIVWSVWHDLPRHYAHVGLDSFIVMPNHVHGIIVLRDPPFAGPGPIPLAAPDDRAGLRPAPTGTRRHGLPEIVRALKSFSARRINKLRGASCVAVWQRGYFEHIIPNEKAYHAVRYYIAENPANWGADPENPGLCDGHE